MNITFGIKKGLVGFGLFSLFALTACNKKDIPFGSNFLESFTDILIIDTLTPVLSTYKLDSFPTSGSGTLILGGYKDPVFGLTKAASYFQLGLPAATFNVDDKFDSLTFIITPNKQFYGDTTIAQQIGVYELTQTLELAPEKTQFFNTHPAFASNSTELGKKQLLPKPSRTDSIEIRLSDAKGLELFQKLKDKTNEVLNQDNFLRYFKGVTLKSTPDAAAIMGYIVSDSTLKMRLYYHPTGPTLVSQHIEFPVINTNLQYNEIVIDRTGTPLANLPAGYPTVPSEALGNAAYSQYATGLLTKITFPYLKNLLNIDRSGKILKAELIIKPVPGSYNYPFTLPPQLELSLTDNTNQIGPVQGTADLFMDYITGENTSYTMDITSFLQSQINYNVVNQQGLMVYSPSNSAFNRLVIGDVKSGRLKIQVKINYLKIK